MTESGLDLELMVVGCKLLLASSSSSSWPQPCGIGTRRGRADALLHLFGRLDKKKRKREGRENGLTYQEGNNPKRRRRRCPDAVSTFGDQQTEMESRGASERASEGELG